MKIVRYDVWSLDVWGNEQDGFQVNDRSCFARDVEFKTHPRGYNRGTDGEFWSHWPSDLQVLNRLKEIGFMKDHITLDDILIDGEYEYSLYIEDSETTEPICQLEFVED